MYTSANCSLAALAVQQSLSAVIGHIQILLTAISNGNCCLHKQTSLFDMLLMPLESVRAHEEWYDALKAELLHALTVLGTHAANTALWHIHDLFMAGKCEPNVHVQLCLCLLQIQPPGMHMIYLPFSDDLRHPEADPAFTGASNPQADDAQIAAAETMLHALNLKGFDSAGIPNPSLQRHYQVCKL